MTKKTEHSKNSVSLAVYFGIGIGLIILISLIFKGIDLFRNSKFDSGHRLSVAIVGQDSTQVLSISPREGTMVRLAINGKLSPESLKSMALPIDSYIESSELDIKKISPKDEFAKTLFNIRKVKTDLSIVDLIRLSIYSGGISEDNINEEEIALRDKAKIDELASNLFKDPQITSEKINIQITNTTDVSGLGNKLAKYVSNIGGVIVLVNSSKEKVEESSIVSGEESATVKRLSKILGIPYLLGRGSDLADIVIVLGEDKKELFK